MFLKWFKLPEVSEISSLDHPSATIQHAKIISEKLFLKKLYLNFYHCFRKVLGSSHGSKRIVELGSGGGFIKEVIPNAITSDILKNPWSDVNFSAQNMPFRDNSIDSFLMIDVLHHLPDSRTFFTEAYRCLRIGGVIQMVEPANTFFSQFIFRFFHHEAFDPNAGWEMENVGPLSTANSALPWIIFFRDRAIFEKKFPKLKITRVFSHTPFRYLASGGLSFRQLFPDCLYNIFFLLERLLTPLNPYIGLFLTINIKKIG